MTKIEKCMSMFEMTLKSLASIHSKISVIENENVKFENENKLLKTQNRILKQLGTDLSSPSETDIDEKHKHRMIDKQVDNSDGSSFYHERSRSNSLGKRKSKNFRLGIGIRTSHVEEDSKEHDNIIGKDRERANSNSVVDSPFKTIISA
eukprot:UN32388